MNLSSWCFFLVGSGKNSNMSKYIQKWQFVFWFFFFFSFLTSYIDNACYFPGNIRISVTIFFSRSRPSFSETEFSVLNSCKELENVSCPWESKSRKLWKATFTCIVTANNSGTASWFCKPRLPDFSLIFSHLWGGAQADSEGSHRVCSVK